MINNKTKEEIAEEHRLRKARETASHKYVMENKLGRQFIHDLIASCSVYGTTFDSDMPTMCRKEGKRQVGLSVMARVNEHAPADYIKLLKENSPLPREGKKKTDKGRS